MTKFCNHSSLEDCFATLQIAYILPSMARNDESDNQLPQNDIIY